METLGVVIIVLFCGWIYFLPTLFAFKRQHPHRWPIFVINAVFGETVIGWFGALVWALQIASLPNGTNSAEVAIGGFGVLINDLKSARIFGAQANPPRQRLTVDAALQLIEQLMTLKAGSHLTEEEFQSMKAAILRRIS